MMIQRYAILGLVGLLLTLSVPLSAQQIISGPIAAAQETISAQPATRASVGLQVVGTWVGTLTFEGSADGGTYVAIPATNANSGVAASTTTANGIFVVTNAGYQFIRARASAWTSGSATVTITGGAGSGGGSSGGTVTQGTDPWIVAGNKTNNGAAPGTNNVGSLPAVATAAAPSYTEGRQVALSTGLAGSQRVQGDRTFNGAAYNTAVAVQTLPFYATASDSSGWTEERAVGGSVTLAGFLRTRSLTVDADDASIAAAQTNNNVNGLGMAYDGSVWRRVTFGVAGTASAQVTTIQGIASMTPVIVTGNQSNNAAAPTATGVQATTAIASAAAQSYTEGRAVLPRVNLFGALPTFYTDPTTGAATSLATDATFGTSTYTEATSTGPVAGAVRTDALATKVNTTNEIAPLQVNEVGALWSALRDPCSWKAKLFYVINTTSAATFEIANAVAGEFWYICSVNVVVGAAQGLLLAHDDTDGCGSITAGMNGGTTAATGWQLAANGGAAPSGGNGTIMKSATANHYLCLVTSTTAQTSGTIVYVSAP